MGAGASAGVFVAAAAMATGSAAPARADFDALIDPIIQPLLSSFTDAISAVDPAAALDMTSWTDSVLASLNTSFESLLPSTDSALAAASSSAEPASTAALTTATIPITVAEGTEPTVGATVDGASSTLLVDSGSSGLVVPLTTLDGGSTNFMTELQSLFSLGLPTNFGEGGYSGGVEYFYLDYNEPVSYTTATGSVGEATVPIEVEVYSYNPSDLSSLFTNDAFQNFDQSNDVTGILGIGTTGTGGAGESPIEAAGYQGVTVSLSGDGGTLTLDPTADTAGTQLTATGSTISGLTETVTNGSTTVGTATGVSDDLDTGGVYGTLPSSISSTALTPGDVVTVSENGTTLYSYTVGAGESPDITSGTSIDSGELALDGHTLSIDYGNGDLYLH
jgi:hypothetical protein